MKRLRLADTALVGLAVVVLAYGLHVRYWGGNAGPDSMTTSVAAIQARGRLAALSLEKEYGGLQLRRAPTVVHSQSRQESVLAFRDPTLLLLMSPGGCNPCQVRELANASYIRSRFGSDLKVTSVLISSAIGLDRLTEEALILRKLARVEDPVFVTEDSLFERQVIGGRFPVFLLVEDGRVASSHAPISADSEYSELYLDKLARLMGAP